eukprot:TRINITY_DN6506_c0_g1_i1.p1 TRINITY_DN6506_c0_g1~~TRINITY_DN6506_c0_g1_i1.p1  ORF type:complete len:269 (-),score=7.61 TRINITY_DN6506_c0_g1_i1:342-1148(-)
MSIVSVVLFDGQISSKGSYFATSLNELKKKMDLVLEEGTCVYLVENLEDLNRVRVLFKIDQENFSGENVSILITNKLLSPYQILSNNSTTNQESEGLENVDHKNKIMCEYCECYQYTILRDDHYVVCPEREISCPLGCGVKLKKKYFVDHREACPANSNLGDKIECKYCGVRVSESFMEDHLELCPEFVIKCPLQCDQSMTRKDWANHILQCTMYRVRCSTCNLGQTRIEYHEHEESHHASHSTGYVVCRCGKVHGKKSHSSKRCIIS